MNRITSRHLPRARQLLNAFRDQGSKTDDGKRLDAKAELVRQRSPGGWPVSRSQLSAEIQQRLDGVTLPQQRGTSYCGCAAFLYCVLEDRPDWYVAYATALWNGTPFTFASEREKQIVTATAETKGSLTTIHQTVSKYPKISNLDWMTMASLSAATRRSRSAGPTTARPTDERQSITWPWMVKRWFASVGAPAKLDSVGMGISNASQDDLLELLGRWDGHWLVIEIDSSMLEGGNTSIRQRHWVVVDPERRPLIQPPGQNGGISPIAFKAWKKNSVSKERSAVAGQAALDYAGTALTNLRVVSWGNEHHPIKGGTLESVCERFYGGYAFPRFNQ